MPPPFTVAVFCGSQPGNLPAFRGAATALGHGLAARGMRLVFGGGRIGLMGALSDAAVAAGGAVTGVIPTFLREREVAHDRLGQLIVTDSMHSRKRRMFAEADAFVTLPGGLGTLDETIEVMTWRQLGLHDKPILICDVAGSARPLLALIEAVIGWGFAPPAARTLYEVVDGAAPLLDRLAALAALPRSAAGAADELTEF